MRRKEPVIIERKQLRKREAELIKDQFASSLRIVYETFYNPAVVFGLLCVSWYMSYSGVVSLASFLGEASRESTYLALVVTLASTASQYALWHYAMRLIPRYNTRAAVGLGLGVAAFLMLCLGLSSTFTGFIGLASQNAQVRHLVAENEKYARQITLIEERSAAMKDMLFVVAPQVETACLRYDAELSSGVITGSAGRGSVTNAFLRICESKRKISEELEETIRLNNERSDVIKVIIRQMDEEVFDANRPMRERQLTFLRLSRGIDDELKAMKLDDRTRAVEASFAILADSVGELDGSEGGLRQKQADAISQIATEERMAAGEMQAMIDEIKASPVPELERVQYPGPQEVVLEHWRRYFVYLGLVVVIDGFPILSMLLLWAATMRDRRHV